MERVEYFTGELLSGDDEGTAWRVWDEILCTRTISGFDDGDGLRLCVECRPWSDVLRRDRQRAKW